MIMIILIPLLAATLCFLAYSHGFKQGMEVMIGLIERKTKEEIDKYLEDKTK